MNTRILTATALMAVIPMLANAQPPTHTPPTPAQIVANQVARLTKLLDLNAMQQTEATGYFTTEQTALATIRPEMQTARATLKTDITTGNMTDIATQAGAIGGLTTKELEAQATADASFYAVLSAEQQSKYESLGHGGGFGGPGGPGGPHGTH